MQITEQIEIDRPPEDVWAVISDPNTHTVWRPALVEFDHLSDGPLEVGSRIREVLRFRSREIELDDVVTALDPPSRFGIRGGSKAAAFESDLVLERMGAGTRVTFDWTLHPKTLLTRAGAPFLRGAMGRATKEELVHLKAYVEDTSGARTA